MERRLVQKSDSNKGVIVAKGLYFICGFLVASSLAAYININRGEKFLRLKKRGPAFKISVLYRKLNRVSQDKLQNKYLEGIRI